MRRGYTLIELVVSMVLMTFVLSIVFLIPKELYETRKLLQGASEYTTTYSLVETSVLQDMGGLGEVVSLEPNVLSIKGVTYTFGTGGVVREKEGREQKLTEKEMIYKIEGEILYIEDKEGEIKQRYNIKRGRLTEGREN